MVAPETFALAIGLTANTMAVRVEQEAGAVPAFAVILRMPVTDAASQSAPSIDEFRRLASEDPQRLVAWIPTLSPPDLTYAAEALGDVDPAAALPVLRRLLRDHPKSYVREGALYGLERLDSADAQAEVARASTHDPSPGLREIASEILEG
jgi:hypothetical protein